MRLAWRQIRARRARSLALLLAVLVAVSGYTVLTGATTTSQLAVTTKVAANSRSAYDVLVRPANSRTALEGGEALVQPNQLSGQYGGISVSQWRRIQALPGVEVAAPVATIGSVAVVAKAAVDVTALLDPAEASQVVRLRLAWVADGGLTRATEPDPQFVYVTRNRVAVPFATPDGVVLPDGRLLTARTLLDEHCDWRSIPFLYVELLPARGWQPICGTQVLTTPGGSGDAVANLSRLVVFQRLPDGTFLDFANVGDQVDESRGITTEPRATPRATFDVGWPVWVGVAAVDPDEEDRLVGLKGAVTSGRYFPEVTQQSAGPLEVPALVSGSTADTEQLSVTADRLRAAPVVATGPQPLLAQLTAAPSLDQLRTSYSAVNVYSAALADLAASVRLDTSVAPSSPSYLVGPGGVLTPLAVPVDATAWVTSVTAFGGQATGALAFEPYLANDLGFRTLRHTSIRALTDVVERPQVDRYGVFDSSLLTEFSGLSAVPLETYRSASVTGSDKGSRSLLGGRPLLPAGDPAAYLTAPPALLIPLDAAQRLTSSPDPISAIRIRVAGVTGIDALSRERVRLVAERVMKATGLDVDITVGSSPQLRQIVLPAGRFGRPELHLAEPWTKEGVAVSIIKAVDRKSVLLFALVLLTCLLFVANATSAVVRSRRRELAVLACLGWPAWRRAALIVTEVTAIGAAAGVLAACVAVPLGRALGLDVSAAHAWLAVPVAVTVTTLASLLPAVRAAPAHPAGTVNPAVARVRATGRVQGLPGLAAKNLLRVPGRTAVAVTCLTIAVSALTMLTALMWAFDGTVTGTLLGSAVSVQARQVDVIAVAATVVIALFAVVDVLYLNLRERRDEMALLRATGWSERTLGSLVMWEVLAVALMGTTGGTCLGVLGAAWFAGGASVALLQVAAVIGMGSVLVTLLAGLLPAVTLDRQPSAPLLAEQ
jgi:putative ABC transport system permease protein